MEDHKHWIALSIAAIGGGIAFYLNQRDESKDEDTIEEDYEKEKEKELPKVKAKAKTKRNRST